MTERFSDQDAQMLVDAAQAAPLANLAAANMLAAMLVRFQAFYKDACDALKARDAFNARLNTPDVPSETPPPPPDVPPVADPHNDASAIQARRAQTLALALAGDPDPAA